MFLKLACYSPKTCSMSIIDGNYIIKIIDDFNIKLNYDHDNGTITIIPKIGKSTATIVVHINDDEIEIMDMMFKNFHDDYNVMNEHIIYFNDENGNNITITYRINDSKTEFTLDVKYIEVADKLCGKITTVFGIDTKNQNTKEEQ